MTRRPGPAAPDPPPGTGWQGAAVATHPRRRRAAASALLLAAALHAGTGALPAAAEAPDVRDATVARLADDLASGRTTSQDLVRAYQRRIALHDGGPGGGVNAFLAESSYAQADARERDRERAAGRLRGPLHGVPVVVKGNTDTADLPTTAGSVALAGTRPPDDALVVQRLREAGAVVLGTTNLHELARGITTVSSLGGQTRNPFDQALVPGGSSGGTAAAVAAGFAPVGTGTDTCGSLRIPAAFTSLVGVRPSQDALPTDGVVPLSRTSDVVGAIGLSVADVARTLDVMAAAPGRFSGQLGGTPLAGARIGVWTPYRDAADARTRGALDATAEELRSRGATVVDVSSDRVTTAAAGAGVITWEAAQDVDAYLAQPGYRFPAGLAGRAAPTDRVTLADLVADGRVVPSVLPGLRSSLATSRSSATYAARMADRRDLQVALDDVFAASRLDALLFPAVLTGAVRVGSPQGGGETCRLSAYSGRPAVTVPNSFAGPPGSGVSPNGVELLGRPGEDARLLALADQYATSFRYHRAPPVPGLPTAPSCAGTAPALPDAAGVTTLPDAAGVHGRAVGCLAAQQVTLGRADGTFGPGDPITRGEFAAFLTRSLDRYGLLPAAPPDAFSDDDGTTHEGALDALAALGVLRGTAAGQAAPRDPLPRDQAASLLARAYGVVFAVEPRGRVDVFADDDDSVHAGAVDGLAALGVLQGRDGRALPREPVTRGQMASLVARSLFSLPAA